jgi:selenide, water dikinase
MVHTVDSFHAMLDDPYLLGRIAANHSLGDIFAMGAEPQTALAIATLPYGLESKVEDSLRQMMAGALEVAGAGVRDQRADRSRGGATQGWHAPRRPYHADQAARDRRAVCRRHAPQGARPLDRRRARRDAAVESRCGDLPTRQRRHRLHRRDRFGLLGHMVEMIKASEVDVELDLSTMPLIDGALETVAGGITSSLQPQNLRLRRAVRDLGTVGGDPRYPLLFDPQTAGGLLATVPEGRAEACVAQLRGLGYVRTSVIGRVLPQTNRLEPLTLLT